MHDFQRKFSMENYKREKRSHGQKILYKDTLKASLEDFEIPMGSCEQNTQERSKWFTLVKFLSGKPLYLSAEAVCISARCRRKKVLKSFFCMNPDFRQKYTFISSDLLNYVALYFKVC